MGAQEKGPGGCSVEPALRSGDERLESWKEIAAYLRRDERTVRRWEKQEGLPVRRHVHHRQASIYAYKSELDAWRENRGPRTENGPSSSGWTRVQFNGLRVAAGGLVWFLAYNLLTGAAWFALVRDRGLPSFHPLLGSQAPTNRQAASMLAIPLLMGLSAMWFYVVVRSRYGSRLVTTAIAGAALWLFWGLLPNLTPIAMQSLPTGPLLVELGSKLVVMALATIAAASVYRHAASGADPNIPKSSS